MTRSQRALAIGVSLAFTVVTLALVPVASQPMAPMPGFVAAYQSALIAVYAVTTFLLFAQYRRTLSVPLLLLGVGSLYTTLIVFVQLLTFPNVFGQGRILGSSPDTTTWLWTLWHIGPPLFALPYAIMEGDGLDRRVPAARAELVGWLAMAGTLAIVCVLCLVVVRYVAMLPKTVDGDDYWLLTTSGVGPAVVALTVLALATLCWTTRLRTVLQLWLAVSLLLLVLDNMVTLPGAARESVGWVAGRLEALIAGAVLLGVYLREVDFLYGRAEHTAEQRERQRAELERARDHLAIALEASGMAEWELDLATDEMRREVRHDRVFGYEALQPRWGWNDFRAHVLPEDRPLVDAAFAAAKTDDALDVECRIRRGDDGATRWVVMRGKVYRDASGVPSRMAGLVMDTTDRREAQERVTQGKRMEAIGQLTGGVAHDFNNLLTVVIGNLDMIVRRPGEALRVERLAGSALLAARRGADVTEKLLSFSRRQLLRPETVNPNRLLTDFRTLLQRAAGETVKVEFDLDPILDPVRLDPGQFESAILNLTVNARDAMPSGGVITIRTRNIVIEEGSSGPMELGPGDYVHIAVADTGLGMDAHTAARAFEPFFTTKDVGRGTGLGLSQVYGFARQGGGQVALSSRPGEGTTIEIYLSRSTETAVDKAPVTIVPLRRATDGEVVLVVEDEPAVLAMAVESLVELGYRALTAMHAAAALDRLKGPERIDVLFSDVVMPGGMNGVQLAVEARRLRPSLRVLLTSGYTGTALDDNEVPSDQPLLNKPYLREDLADKLRLVMGRR